MSKALHPRSEIHRLYVSRKEGGLELTNIEDSVDILIRRFKASIKKTKEKLISVSRNNANNTNINKTTITMIRKAIVCIFQEINKRNFTGENLGMAKKGKP